MPKDRHHLSVIDFFKWKNPDIHFPGLNSQVRDVKLQTLPNPDRIDRWTSRRKNKSSSRFFFLTAFLGFSF